MCANSTDRCLPGPAAVGSRRRAIENAGSIAFIALLLVTPVAAFRLASQASIAWRAAAAVVLTMAAACAGGLVIRRVVAWLTRLLGDR